MAPRRYSQEVLRQALEFPGPAGRLGLRVVSSITELGREALHFVAPAEYRCSRLVAQLADEWVEYVAATRISRGPVATYSRAIDRLGKFVDAAPEASDTAESLSLESEIVVRLLARWERTLPESYSPGSKWPKFLADAVRILIVRRDDHAERDVETRLSRFARGKALTAAGESMERDEFTLEEKRAMVRAAWNAVIALEKRLAAGWAMATQGRHPDQGSWFSLPDLLWGLSHGEIDLKDISAALPVLEKWTPELQALVQYEDGAPVYPQTAKLRLNSQLVAQLYPATQDLHAFRVLLVDTTGRASEEVTSFGEGDVEFLPHGVRLTFVKKRAELVRHRAFRDSAKSLAVGSGGDEQAITYNITDGPRREASAVVRRLLAVTAKTREKVPHLTDTLFVTARVRAGHCLAFDTWVPNGGPEARFEGWLASVGVEVAGEKHIGRLRKSTKVEKVIASGGRISTAADDHLEETFAGHYAQGTTLRVLSGRVIATAQDHWFHKAVQGPTVVAAEAEGALKDSEALKSLALEEGQAEGIIQGQLDMGVSHCKDPYDSPFSPRGELCAVAPLRCLECRNAWILPGQLPQLLLFERHLENLKRRMPPKSFTALWGQSYVNLRAVLAARSDQELDLARASIEAGRTELDLPLTAQVEFDQ
ncbi:hypothetical protein [Streptomyces sp. Agncl-13]|uniref:hypothetical protein n=1 Tax=Streptomyces sp. Agncl-13 TaxID=3400628 RepID=UPI003A863528